MNRIAPHPSRHLIRAAITVLTGLSLAGIAPAAQPAQPVTTSDAISVPPLVNYQGRLTDASGNPINGTRDMAFAVYDVAVGGTPLWTETQPGVTITSGLFNVLLGSVTPLTSVPDGPDCYLQVTVAGEAIAPRVRIVSAGYSFSAGRAEDANNLGGVPATGYIRGVTATAPLASTGGQNPNLTLSASGVAAGTYGSDTTVARVTVDSRGLVTNAANVRIAGSPAENPNGNLMFCGAGNSFYTVPTGKSLMLYGVALGNYCALSVNGSYIFIGGSGSGYAFNYIPPIVYPAGTYFSTNSSSYYASLYGYVYTTDAPR